MTTKFIIPIAAFPWIGHEGFPQYMAKNTSQFYMLSTVLVNTCLSLKTIQRTISDVKVDFLIAVSVVWL